MQAQLTKLLSRARTAAQATAQSPPGQVAWTVYAKTGELFGVNVNEPVFGKDAELKTQTDLAQAASKGLIVTDPAAQSKLWNQAYYTALWEYVGACNVHWGSTAWRRDMPTQSINFRANNSWQLATKDYETIRAAVKDTPVLDYNLKAVRVARESVQQPDLISTLR
jgi:hypothetical protein